MLPLRPLRVLFAPAVTALALTFGCSALPAADSATAGGGGHGGSASGVTGSGGASAACDTCGLGSVYTPCKPDGSPGAPVTCPAACAPGKGCVACAPGALVCVGNEVHGCTPDGSGPGPVVQTCKVDAGEVCSDGKCGNACQMAAGQPSNLGCEFWAADLDQQDAFNNPANGPWGVALSNAGAGQANVTIEINTAPVGQPPVTQLVQQLSVAAGSLKAIILPVRTLDCGVKVNDYMAPGTCLSSRAFRITSSVPIVVYQFNNFYNSFSNDASLLLPTNALGKSYRVMGWPAGHPVPVFGIIDRAYVTIVGVEAGTVVTVNPSWRIKGNPPIAATAAGGQIVATIGPFDVLNLETDDATFQDDPKLATDLSSSLVQATKPVAVFTGVETAGAPDGVIDLPTPPGWMSGNTCCLDHLEEQLMPIESVGMHYVITRSPVRSTTGYREPDILRFVGVAETSNVKTNLPPPFDAFVILPGQTKTTWTQNDVVVSADKPVMVGQILVSEQYCDGVYIGDPSLTIYPPIEQFRSDYLILTPPSWTQSWIVIAAEVGAVVTLDGAPATGCIVEPSGMLLGKAYESRKCKVADGVHALAADKPFGIVAYGYGSAGSYALIGGANVKHIYDPPPIK